MSFVADGYSNLIAGLSPARDKAMNAVYSKTPYSVETFLALYSDSPIAKAVIDQIPDDCTRKWRTWQGEDDQVTALERLEKKLKLRQTINWCDKMARLFGEYYAFIDVGQSPELPLDPASVGKDGLRFVIPMSQNQMIPGEYETDPLSPDYGSPSYYNVSSAHSGLVRIHPSRVVRFYGSELPENGYGFKRGESVLQSLMTSVIHYDGTMTNVASLIFEAKIDIIKVPDLASLLADPVTETQVINRYNLAGLMKGNNGMLLLSGASSKDGVGEEYEQKQMSFSGLTDIIDRMQMQVAGAANSNRSRMFGVSAGGLGSNGNLELSTYYDFINSRQTNHLEPAITLLDEVVIRSALGLRPDDVWYQWNSLWQTSDKEKADIGVALANAAKSLIDGGLFTAEILAEPVSLALVNAGVFPGLDQSLADFIQSGGEMEPEPEIEELPPLQIKPDPIKDAQHDDAINYEKEALEVLREALATK